MSDTALMLFKPEFNLIERRRFYPLIRDYLTLFNLSVEKECEICTRDEKELLFDCVYSRLLKNARSKYEDNCIGGYTYLALKAQITDEQLFREWVSPQNIALSLKEDCYYLQKDGQKVINPFCPYQRRLFTESTTSVHLFLLSKNSSLSWSEIKPLF
ncbi:hypothetical protein [Pantoea sp. Nvir]|uniref:hypothetical protein n=1 Tax=Pantoea sp. Nvir TaxID=2576760 RepID=UPI00135C4FE1|nr:hypothetical protein [Pantoea sp. Nvir]MXP67114.1 hypothetical protein [Pantoea sp. Nvir]CAJ0993607.1 hypothetical protein NVIRPANT_01063 [Pantoea sp. Nvir]